MQTNWESDLMKLDSIGDWRRTHYSVDIKPELDGHAVTLFAGFKM